jgi:hypothetical protein
MYISRDSKTKTRLVHAEDDRRAAVPPQFAELHHKGPQGAPRFLFSALCDWLSPVHAVTGIPVTVYLSVCHVENVTYQISSSTIPGDFSAVSLWRLPPCASFSIKVPGRLLLLNERDYMRRKTISQGLPNVGRFFFCRWLTKVLFTQYNEGCQEKLRSSLALTNNALIGRC